MQEGSVDLIEFIDTNFRSSITDNHVLYYVNANHLITKTRDSISTWEACVVGRIIFILIRDYLDFSY